MFLRALCVAVLYNLPTVFLRVLCAAVLERPQIRIFSPIYTFMIWQILRVWVSFILPPFYKRLQAKNIQHALADGPVIIAMNHPNSFVDPILFTMLAHPVQPRFLARGDAFKPGLATWFLEQIGIVPIFRIQDGGKEGLKKNEDAYRRVNYFLSKDRKVIIFAEGLCIMERRLRPLKKGVARMVFGAYDSLNYDKLVVVPVGVNYSQPDKFRSNCFINVGEAIPVKDYIEEYRKQPARTQNRFIQDLEPKMKALITHIQDPANDQAVLWAETLVKRSRLLQRGMDPQNLEQDFIVLQELTEQVNKAQQDNNPALTEFKSEAAAYFSLLQKNKLRDWLLDPSVTTSQTQLALAGRFLLLLAGLPIFLCGLIGNLLPFIFTDKLTRKMIRTVEFYTSIATGVGMALFLVYYILMYFIIGAVLPEKIWPALGLLFFMFCGAFSIRYYPFHKKTQGIARLAMDKGLKANLKSRREHLLLLINKF